MKIKRAKTFDELTDADLAAFYKFMGYQKHYAWDKYLFDRALKPTINAKDFYAIFEFVSASPLPETQEEIEYIPTHLDTATDHNCMIFLQADGIYRVIWDTGYHGTYPHCHPPESTRFLAIQKVAK